MTNTLKLAGILILISLIMSIGINLIDKTILFKSSFIFGSLLISIIVLIVGGRMLLRGSDTDILSYGKAVKKLLIAMTISYLVSMAIMVMIYQNDGEMKKIFHDYSIEVQEKALKMGLNFAGADDVQIESELAKMREQRASGTIPAPVYPYTWSALPTSSLMSLIFGFILSLIAAIFVREKETSYS